VRLGKIALVGVLAATGCSRADTTGGLERTSFLRASVQGSVRAEYSGTGEFGMDHLPRTFVLSSTGTGGATGQSLVLRRRQDSAWPAVGRYPLVTVQNAAADPQGFTAVYSRTDGRGHESFVARSGAVEITRASAERVEGTFRFEAVLCSGRSEDQGSFGDCAATDVATDARTVELTGSFAVTPMSNVGMPL
jgi:hypothetical protein